MARARGVGPPPRGRFIYECRTQVGCGNEIGSMSVRRRFVLNPTVKGGKHVGGSLKTIGRRHGRPREVLSGSQLRAFVLDLAARWSGGQCHAGCRCRLSSCWAEMPASSANYGAGGKEVKMIG